MTPAEYIRRKRLYPVALTTEQVDALSQEFREASAWIVGQNEAYIVEEYYRAAAKLAEGKLSATEARRLVRETLRAAGYQPEKPGSWTDMAGGTARQRLILETNVNKAAGYAWHESVKNSTVLPAQRLVRKGRRMQPRDWQTRWRNAWASLPPEEKRKAHPTEMVALVNCEIWRVLSRWGDPYPPFDYNSGMDVLPVDRESARKLGLEPEAKAAEGEKPSGFGVKRELDGDIPNARKAEIQAWLDAARGKLDEMGGAVVLNHAAHLDSHVVMNAGPGGPDCEAESAESCRCKGMPKRLPAQSPAARVKMTAALEAAGKSDYDIYREQSKYSLDDTTMQDVVDFKQRRKEKVKVLRERFQGTKVMRQDKALPSVEITKEGIKEMTNDKALDRSVRLGCSVAEYEESLDRMDEFIASAVNKGSRPGGQGRHNGNDKTVAVTTLRKTYVSRVSGATCQAVYTVHEVTDGPPKAYFMYTKKERPKQ